MILNPWVEWALKAFVLLIMFFLYTIVIRLSMIGAYVGMVGKWEKETLASLLVMTLPFLIVALIVLIL
jgi:hypothetical protein